jgi:hypothetical protein
MPEKLRRKARRSVLRGDGQYSIRSWVFPQLWRDILWLRGNDKNRDGEKTEYIYPSEESAQEAVAAFGGLIAKINADLAKKGKVRK